jgi:hypothetical protein
VDLDVRPVLDTFKRLTCLFSVELPGIEPASLAGNMPSELQVARSRSGSVPLVTCGFVLGS